MAQGGGGGGQGKDRGSQGDGRGGSSCSIHDSISPSICTDQSWGCNLFPQGYDHLRRVAVRSCWGGGGQG
ncbi:MAG: hypothetical protein OZSIB_1271 [Candidatus Ozemobacter sibiricus]|uniref:Uncharacterized protein n=1 Tax=Candidatus Ozemobacter sibiricus TaxID=2268124 RepID=A0A367ZLA5_9BACT|nr:MAG: hypothetical protein OZSIB_1271 [Candidatus Ozemobacter sibiricus]